MDLGQCFYHYLEQKWAEVRTSIQKLPSGLRGTLKSVRKRVLLMGSFYTLKGKLLLDVVRSFLKERIFVQEPMTMNTLECP